mgnify:CR=1 FL=1
MNAPDRLQPAFLDGQVKGLFIDGRSRPALSGQTFATISPSTGEVLAQVAQAGKDDIDLAVAAARRRMKRQPACSRPNLISC